MFATESSDAELIMFIQLHAKGLKMKLHGQVVLMVMNSNTYHIVDNYVK